MELKQETITFFTFIILGIITGAIFDFFRALRKVRKCDVKAVYIQDIIFFTIIGLLLASVLIYKLEDELRIYLFISIFLGIAIYISTLSKIVMKVFVNFITISGKIFMFIILPFTIYEKIVKISYNFLANFIKKCCNRMNYMISYFYNKINFKIHKINLKKR